jgi:2-keto-4-pentenoate hydratase/2-oxohepta-3-ene-1,7-dioic acid hydratase in catechol pathway
MKLVTYDSNGGPRVGVLENGGVVDAGFDGDMVAFIEAGAPAGDRMSVGAARLLAPLRPRSLRDFIGFRGHMENMARSTGQPIPPNWETTPGYYKGLPDTVIGPEEEIPWPSYTEKLDYELELACVIGRRGKDIARERAREYIFGWTIWNDVSARDRQILEMGVGPIGPGKAKDWDGSNVLGPCIVTADELDVSNLKMDVRINGERWGGDTSGGLHHRFEDMIAYISMDQTIYPGEILGSGTAATGAGAEIDRWVQPGDVIELEIEGIGVLRNTIGGKRG